MHNSFRTVSHRSRNRITSSAARIGARSSARHRIALPRSPRPGFTLIELLVVVAIAALLMSLILGVATKIRAGARGVACRSQLRAVALDFIDFAEDRKQDRGKSNAMPRNQFHLHDFVNKAYRVEYFWPTGDRNRQQLDSSSEPLMCPAGPGELSREGGRSRPCNDGAIGPKENVSVAFNRRLFYETRFFEGKRVAVEAKLNSDVLGHSEVPLAFDVDGSKAVRNAVTPYFSAPAVPGHDDVYDTGRFWFPQLRHGGKMNVVFIGGHALSTAQPLDEPGWDWKYQFGPTGKPSK